MGSDLGHERVGVMNPLSAAKPEPKRDGVDQLRIGWCELLGVGHGVDQRTNREQGKGGGDADRLPSLEQTGATFVDENPHHVLLKCDEEK